jgi:transcriptional regulator with XRE-family HTH domain
MVGKLTFAQFAERVGVTASAISKAVAAGRLTADADGLLDAATAEVQWVHNRRRRRRPRRTDPSLEVLAEPATAVKDSGQFWDARTRRETAEAELAELKAAEQRGDLVRRSEVERELAAKIVALREHLETMADRLSAVVAAESDPAACRRLLAAEVRLALRAFVAELEAEQ